MIQPDSSFHLSISRGAKTITPFYVMEILERAAELERAGRHVIHMEVGEPDFDTPKAIRQAGIAAIREGKTHYTHSLGIPELREAISEWYSNCYGVTIPSSRIVVTTGSSGAMQLVFHLLVDPGSEVLMPDPHYACYPNFVTLCGGKPVTIPTSEETGFQLDPDTVRKVITPETRALIINSPSNPTGAIIGLERLKQLSSLSNNALTIISDEIYHGLVYQDRAHSILEVSDCAIVISGFSKLFAMTGWRLGYVILPDQLVRPIQKIQQNLFISPPDFTQYAALTALKDCVGEVEHMKKCYDERRQYLLSRLGDCGMSVSFEPLGAFYLFVNVKHYTRDVLSFCYRILEETGVALTPGIDFGEIGKEYIRISYANSLDNLAAGMDRLQTYLADLPEADN